MYLCHDLIWVKNTLLLSEYQDCPLAKICFGALLSQFKRYNAKMTALLMRFFNRFFKFHQEFDHLIVSPKRREGFEMMNIALGGHSNLVTRLRISVGLTFSGLTCNFSVHS